MAAFVKLLESIPILLRLFDELSAAYTNLRIKHFKKEHRDGIKKSIEEQDQRDLEGAIGPGAGEPSGIPGTQIRDKIPGVK